MRKSRETVILLVEDNPDDVELTLTAFEGSDLHIRFEIAVDGKEALDYLHGVVADKKLPRPDLILLDLNLPKVDGRSVLAEIKSAPELSSIPVIVLTTSQSQKDISQIYRLHANCFINKPVDYNDFIKVVHTIDSFWLNIVQLPA
jgi:chemotaxis family two-component system response regulator Rcp1